MSRQPVQQYTLQQLLHTHAWPAVNNHVHRVLQQLAACKTSANGYHLYQCANTLCKQFKYQYHSCHNRHCPQCGAFKKDDWMEARSRELIPVTYYHVVFTLPHELNPIILGNRKQLFNLLFDASAKTLMCFANDNQYLGATPGIISILHTWGQQLSFHPHIHCMVSGGGIITTPHHLQWVTARKNDWRFLFPIKAMAILFRGKFLHGLQCLIRNGQVSPPPGMDTKQLLHKLYSINWNMYAKAPMGGPQQVMQYLAQYTHKTAISNTRIKAFNHQQNTVTFAYKDYADNGTQKLMTIGADEFIRRFAQHILPPHFTKIRSYGYCSNRHRKQRINQLLQHLQLPAHPPPVTVPYTLRLFEKYGIRHDQCPHCGQQTLQLRAISYHTREPPL